MPRISPRPNVGLEVVLKSSGNPDFGQYAPVSPRLVVGIASLAEARARCREYIDEWNLGGGNWTGGQVRRDGKLIATVSYNGRVWSGKGSNADYSNEIQL